MPHFKISLPADLTLLIEIAHNPVDFTIVFPDGKDVHFSFDPNSVPHSSVVVHAGLIKGVIPSTPDTIQMESVSAPSITSRLRGPSSSGAGPTILYAAEVGGSRPMGP